MKQVKLLFLDIDGVLNSKATAYSPLGIRDIDNDKLLLLKRIIDATEAKTLLISSWKEGWYSNPNKKSEQTETADYLDKRFAEAGLRISGKVSDVDFGGRGKASGNIWNDYKPKASSSPASPSSTMTRGITPRWGYPIIWSKPVSLEAG